MIERNLTNLAVRKFIQRVELQRKRNELQAIVLHVDYSDCTPTLEVILIFDNETRTSATEFEYVMGGEELETDEEAYVEAEIMLKEAVKLEKYLKKYYDCVIFDHKINHC